MRRRFHPRAFFTLVTALSFLVLLLTGAVLYVEPHGRIAFWTDWRLWGLGKEQWDGIHIVISVVFLMASIGHIYLNWGVLVRFLTGRLRQGVRHWRELGLASAVVILFAVGAAAGWPPFQWLLDLNTAAKTSWVEAREAKPPYGHAELSTIAELCGRLGIDADIAVGKLQKHGFRVDSSQQTLLEVAGASGSSPHLVFRVIGEGMDYRRGGRSFGKRKRQMRETKPTISGEAGKVP